MIPVSLPSGHRRAVLRSFWICQSGFAGGVVVCAFAWFGNEHGIAFGAGTAALMAALGWNQERFLSRIHRFWNERLVAPARRQAARWVMRLCYFLVVTGAGCAQRGNALEGSPRGGWSERAPLSPAHYTSLYAGSGTSRGGWLRQYGRWAVRTRNAWALGLVPFLWLLRLVTTEDEPAPEANIYTLF